MSPTPYDVALRIRQREIDEMRIAISSEAAELAKVEASQRAADAKLAREREIAASDPLLTSTAFGLRMKVQKHQLKQRHHKIDNRLTELRQEAAGAYGALRAVEIAAEDFRQEHHRSIANAEQSRIDDFAGASFIRRTQAIRDAAAAPKDESR